MISLGREDSVGAEGLEPPTFALQRRDEAPSQSVVTSERIPVSPSPVTASFGEGALAATRIWTAGDTPPRTICSSRRGISIAVLLRSNDRTAVDLVRRDERDLGMGPSRSCQDLILRRELVGSDPGVEDDEHLVPQGVEPLTLDGIDHREEVLLLVEVVRGVDRVDALIVREHRARRWHLEHVDGDLLPLVEDGPL